MHMTSMLLWWLKATVLSSKYLRTTVLFHKSISRHGIYLLWVLAWTWYLLGQGFNWGTLVTRGKITPVLLHVIHTAHLNFANNTLRALFSTDRNKKHRLLSNNLKSSHFAAGDEVMSECKSLPTRQTGIDSLMSRSWVTSCQAGCPVHTLPILLALAVTYIHSNAVMWLIMRILHAPLCVEHWHPHHKIYWEYARNGQQLFLNAYFVKWFEFSSSVCKLNSWWSDQEWLYKGMQSDAMLYTLHESKMMWWKWL